MDFAELANRLHEQKGTPIPEMTLCFDPGHTTGWALFGRLTLYRSGEVDTSDIPTATEHIAKLLEAAVTHVVIEDYRIYKWRAEHHIGSDMLTTRVIGCIETLCTTHYISNIIKQPAHTAKGFCTDKKLKEWGFYTPGQKHARDAIRHGCYFLLHGAIERKQRKGATVG